MTTDYAKCIGTMLIERYNDVVLQEVAEQDPSGLSIPDYDSKSKHGETKLHQNNSKSYFLEHFRIGTRVSGQIRARSLVSWAFLNPLMLAEFCRRRARPQSQGSYSRRRKAVQVDPLGICHRPVTASNIKSPSLQRLRS